MAYQVFIKIILKSARFYWTIPKALSISWLLNYNKDRRKRRMYLHVICCIPNWVHAQISGRGVRTPWKIQIYNSHPNLGKQIFTWTPLEIFFAFGNVFGRFNLNWISRRDTVELYLLFCISFDKFKYSLHRCRSLRKY